VGLRDVLFGKKRLKGANLDRLFALSTARVTLEAEQGLKSSGSGAVIFKPLSASEFVRAENEIQALLDLAAVESGSEIRRQHDDYGYEWLVVRDPDFEDLVTTTHMVSSELKARGFDEQLLAAAFRFDGGKHPVYFIYGYKRAAFWPFVPTGKEQERDNAEELRLKAELEKELPIEQDLTRWFGLFDSPL
jgi:hypothetical protein